jgi:hypothetical protein
MTRYLRSDPFTTNAGDLKKYEEGWERIFGTVIIKPGEPKNTKCRHGKPVGLTCPDCDIEVIVSMPFPTRRHSQR